MSLIHRARGSLYSSSTGKKLLLAETEKDFPLEKYFEA